MRPLVPQAGVHRSIADLPASGCLVEELQQAGLQPVRELRANVPQLVEEGLGSGPRGTPELVRLQRAWERLFQGFEHLSGKVVDALVLAEVDSEAVGRERERPPAQELDVVAGPPPASGRRLRRR